MNFTHKDNVVMYSFDNHVMYAIVIPDRLPPSFNEMINKSREWTKNQRRWFQHYLSKHARPMPRAYLDKRSVRIDLFKKSQADDAPNLDGRSKVILDAMKELGMIVDDNAKYLEWGRVWQRKGKRNGSVTIISETMDSRMLMECHEIAPHAFELITGGQDE
jgi:hypothetical protein